GTGSHTVRSAPRGYRGSAWGPVNLGGRLTPGNARQGSSHIRRTDGPPRQIQRGREGGHRGWREPQRLEPLRVAEQASQRLVACEAAAVEYQPALERLGGKRQVVRDHEQRHAPGRAVEQGARDACPQRPIEPDGRLVEHEQRRLERESAGERGELTEGRREVVRVVPGEHGEVEGLERADSPP